MNHQMIYVQCRYPPAGGQVSYPSIQVSFVIVKISKCLKVSLHVKKIHFCPQHNVRCITFHSLLILLAFLDTGTMKLFFTLFNNLPTSLSSMVSHFFNISGTAQINGFCLDIINFSSSVGSFCCRLCLLCCTVFIPDFYIYG